MPVVAIFVGFMLANSTRIVALNALSTRVPPPADRARFMSLQSAVQHLAISAGAGLSSWVLHERADHSLEGMPVLAIFAIIVSCLALPIVVVALLHRRVRARDAAQNAAALPRNSRIGPIAPRAPRAGLLVGAASVRADRSGSSGVPCALQAHATFRGSEPCAFGAAYPG